MEATHKISACYFPGLDHTLELTWGDITTGEHAELTIVGVHSEVGIKISEVVMACVYHGAVVQDQGGDDD